MTHPPQFTGSREAIQLLAEQGFEGLAAALELLLNEVMKLERSEVLQAAPYERTDDRKLEVQSGIQVHPTSAYLA